MYLELSQCIELVKLLEGARRATLSDADALYCKTPVLGPDGKNYRTEYGVDRRTGAKKEKKAALGVHGRAFLAIDPETMKIVCAKCKGGT